MVDKSGGDVLQANQGGQAGLASQDLNSVGVGGAGVLESMGGAGAATGAASQALQQAQAQAQANMASTGSGGDDNINANTTINIA